MKKLYQFKFATLKSLFVLGLCILSLTSTVLAQGWERFYPPEQGGATSNAIINTLDSNYITVSKTTGGVNGDFGAVYTKFDEAGNTIWTKITPAISTNSYVNNLSDGTYITIGSTVINVPGVGFRHRPLVQKLGADGSIIWDSTYVFPNLDLNIYFNNAIALDDGGFLIGGFHSENVSGGSFARTLGEIEADGQINWINELAFEGFLRERLPNGNVILTSVDSDNIYKYEADANGNLLDTKLIPRLPGTKGFVLNGAETVVVTLQYDDEIGTIDSSFIRQVVFDDNQNIITENSIVIPDYVDIRKVERAGDRIAILGFVGPFWVTGTNLAGLFITTDFESNFEIQKIYDFRPGSQILTSAAASNEAGYIIGGTSGDIFKTDEDGQIYSSVITGNVTIDEDEDCEIDADETAISEWVITAAKDGQFAPFSTITTNDGEYILPVDSGAYTLTLTPVNEYWSVCFNDVELDFIDVDSSETVDFSVQSLVDCPVMNVSTAIRNVRPCAERRLRIEYCNNGTVTAEDVYLEIQFDSLYNVLSSNILWDSISPDNVVTWQLEDMEPFECANFYVDVFLDYLP